MTASPSVDLDAAIGFIEANARLLDRRRMQYALQDGPAEAVLTALRAYRNDDGGFGSALEPDVRGSHSEPTAALHALDVLAEVGALDHPVVAALFAWVDRVALADGGVPFVVPETAHHPRGPWMQPTPGGSHLGFGLAAAGYGRELPWVARGSAWCWSRLGSDEPLDAYTLKFALDFLDAVPAAGPDAARAQDAVARQRELIGTDGTVAVAGGTDGESLSALDLAPRPDGRSRALFTAAQIATGLDRLAAGQRSDGGWEFDWSAWSPGQTAEGRGLVTLRALLTLQAHDRLG